MAQTGYTPISNYYSATAAATPTAGNLVAGELALNTNDGKLYYKDSSGVVQTMASKATTAGTFTTVTASTVTSPAATALTIQSAATTAITVDTSQNVGIGTTSPSYKLTVKGGNANSALIDNDGSQFTQLLLQRNSTANTGGDILIDGTSSQFQIRSLLAGPMVFQTSATAGSPAERMRIDTNGNLLIGTTSTFVNQKLSIQFNETTQSGIGLKNTNASNTGYYASFYNSSGTNQGNIQQVNSSVVSYGTTSDYRLKENIVPMIGSLAKIQALKPVNYQWKIDGSAGQGFIAHELAEIVPECVMGEKDAVDEKGKPIYQNIDTSFLVATLTAAIQEQQAMIEELKTKVLALEAK